MDADDADYIQEEDGKFNGSKGKGGSGTKSSSKASGKSEKSTSITSDAKGTAAIQVVFGDETTAEEIAQMCGAPEGSSVKISAYGNKVTVDVTKGSIDPLSLKGSGILIQSDFSKDSDGNVISHLDLMVVKDESPGTGTEIFSNSVERMAAKGVIRIDMTCEGSKGDPQFNGYSTWPKLGVNGALPKDLISKLEGEGDHETKDFNGFYSRYQEKAIAYWDKNGSTFRGSFDLSEGSTSRQILERYRASKKTAVSDSHIEDKAHAAATSPLNEKPHPTDRQKEAGNYSKGHLSISGLPIAIENPSGSRRRPEWPPLSDHYGYIKGTVGFDKDHLDVFVKPGTDDAYEGPVFVVNQNKDGDFDEHKVMLGWADVESATGGYLSNYTAGQSQNIASVVPMELEAFRAWATDKGESGPAKGMLIIEVKSADDIEFALTDSLDSDYCVLEDSAKSGVLGILRQRITRANTWTKWGFKYVSPGPLDAAIDEANLRFRVPAIHTERYHPATVKDVCDKHGCGVKFVNNFDHVTGTPLRVFPPDSEGWVEASREILDTEDGREVWAAAKRKSPIPVSVRWHCDSEAARTGIPKWIRLVVWDDVDVPAMVGAGEISIFDDFHSEGGVDTMTDLRPEGPLGLGEPFFGVNRNTVNPHPVPDTEPAVEQIANEDSDSTTQVDSALEAHEGKHHLMDRKDIAKAVRGFSLIAKKGTPISTLVPAMATAVAAIKDGYIEGEDVAEFVGTLQGAYRTLRDDGENAAYHSGVEGPYIELGNMMMMDPKSGWAPDLRDVPEDDTKNMGRQIQQSTDKSVHDLKITATDADDEKDKADMEAKKKDDEMEAACDSALLENPRFFPLDGETKRMIKATVKREAGAVEKVKALADSYVQQASSAIGAATKLLALGIGAGGGYAGASTLDMSLPTSLTSRTNEHRPGSLGVEKLLAATDDMLRAGPMVANMEPVNPDDPNVQTRRKFNISKMTPLMDHWEDAQAALIGKDKFWGSITDSADPDAAIMAEAKKITVLTDSYTSALQQVPNQPTIWRWLLTQAFQDQKGLAFASAVGPGQATQSGPGWEDRTGFGRIFRMPYESYVDPAGNGFEYGGLDFSLLYGENQGIQEGTVALFWDTFFPYWRANATSATIQGIKSIGNGPLNYGLGARNVWHMLARKSRAVDKAIFDEMGRIALEYGAVAVTGETYTSGNSGLTNQTVYQNSSATVPGFTATSVVVNLNPTKLASAAVAFTSGVPTDDYSIYPNPAVTPGVGGQVPVAAVRLLTGQAVGKNAAPYFGLNGTTKNPVCPQRNTLNINSAGFDTTGSTTPIAVTAPAGAVQGYLGSDGYIYSLPGTTATWALDPMNGVVLFASGVTNNGGIIGTTVTLGYSYATNFDVFPLTPGINGLAGTLSGETPAAFSNRLLAQFDFTGALMASWPRYVAPDLAIMSATVSPNITEATAFYKLNSPRDTNLYPTEEFFATRNGVDMARINTPWFMQNTAILETRRFSTKYAIDTPADVRGPGIKYDAAGNFIAGEGYYMAENSSIFTPQVKNSQGVLINPVARLVLLITGGQMSCGIPY